MPDPRITWRLTAQDQVSKTVDRIDARLGSLAGSFKAAFRGVAIPASIAAGAGTLVFGFARLGRQALEMADEIQDASEKLGVSAEYLQRLKLAAEQTGGSFEGLQAAMVFLARTTGDAVRGSEKASAAFDRLGIDAQKLAALPLDRRLAVVAAQLQKLPDAADKADFGSRVLGRSFADQIPLLSKLDDELAKTNAVLSNEQVKALADAKDAWERWGNFAIVQTGRVLTGAERLYKWLRENSDLAAIERARGGPTPKPAPKRQPLSIEEAAAIVGLPGKQVLDGIETNIAASMKAVNDAIRAYDDERKRITEKTADDIARITEQTRTPLEHYRVDIARVNELMRSGLSADIAAREIQRLGSVLGAETQALADATQAGQAWNRSVEDAARIIASLEQPIDRAAAAYRRIDELLKEGRLSPDQVAAAKTQAIDELIGKVDKAATAVDARTQSLLESIKNATEGIARDITDIFFDTTKSIGDMFADVFDRIARMAVEKAIVQPFVDLISGAISGLVTGGLETIDLSKLPKKRAHGGPVTAGQPYLVGEEGPELFMPRQSGRIVPNGAAVGNTLNINFAITSLDPQSAASVIAANERVITNVIRRAQARAGYAPTV